MFALVGLRDLFCETGGLDCFSINLFYYSSCDGSSLKYHMMDTIYVQTDNVSNTWRFCNAFRKLSCIKNLHFYWITTSEKHGYLKIKRERIDNDCVSFDSLKTSSKRIKSTLVLLIQNLVIRIPLSRITLDVDLSTCWTKTRFIMLETFIELQWIIT